MDTLIAYGVVVLGLMACWGGLALAKAAHQREEAEGESLYSDPARPRVVSTSAHGARPQRLRDQSSMARARASASDQAVIGARPMWLADRQTHESGGDTAA